MCPTRFGQGTHPPSLSRIGVASKERTTVDDGRWTNGNGKSSHLS